MPLVLSLSTALTFAAAFLAASLVHALLAALDVESPAALPLRAALRIVVFRLPAALRAARNCWARLRGRAPEPEEPGKARRNARRARESAAAATAAPAAVERPDPASAAAAPAAAAASKPAPTVTATDAPDAAPSGEAESDEPADGGSSATLRLSQGIELPDADEKILEPVHYMKTLRGKGLRRKMALLLVTTLGVPKHWRAQLMVLAEDMHALSLILDDIQDGSVKRRGHSAAHVKYGVAWAMNASLLRIVQVARTIFTEWPHAVFAVFMEELQNAFMGQGLDIYFRDTQTCPTEREYCNMVSHKTTIIFRAIVRAAALLSPLGNEIDVPQLVEDIEQFGLWFQIRDDLHNLTDEVYSDTKGFAEDLDECKFSYPVVFLKSRGSEGEWEAFSRQWRKRDKTVEEKRVLVGVLRDAGVLAQTQKRLEEIRDLLLAETAWPLLFRTLFSFLGP